MIRDHGVSYLTDGNRTLGVSFLNLNLQGDSLFLTDSANRRAYYLSLHDGRLTSLNLDTQQQSTELFDPSQLLTYNSSTAIYAAPGGALLVTGAGFFLVP